jgi:hypothetical protein
MNTLLEDFKEHLKYLESRCLKHPQDFNLDNVVEVLHWDNDGSDEPSEAAIARMSDNKFLAFEGSEDYTGHG